MAFGIGVLGLNLAVIFILVVFTLGGVNHAFKKVLIHLKRSQGRMDSRGGDGGELGSFKVADKVIASLRDLRVSMGSFLYYDRGLVLTKMGILLECSSNLILLY